jgi:hypothetical protein
MKCINHPEVDAAGPCVRCGTGLCDDCRRELGMKFYCQSCAHEILTQKTSPVATATCGRKSRIAGIRLLILGIVGCVLSLFLILALFGNDDPKGPAGMFYIAIALSVISPILVVIGLSRIITGASGISLASLVCGILSILDIRSILPISLIFGLLAIIFGLISLAKLKKNPLRGGRKTAIAGMVMGIIGIVAYGIWYLVFWLHIIHPR